ncbi:MAG: hypothetical protein OES25_10385 [Acidobacteriota bacterium]|nr:hypothetical protein [Acidobacteriota bacterium]
MALVVTVSTSVAQGPAQGGCGETVNAQGETETSIQLCMGGLLDEQEIMIDALETMEVEMRAIHAQLVRGKLMIPGQLRLMRNDTEDIQMLRDQLDRGRQDNLAVEDADYDGAFEMADQKKGKDCKFSDRVFFESLEEGEFPPGLKPFSGNSFDMKFGDGKCNVFKARIDDPNGPDDNEMVRVNERTENMCERVCEDRMGNGSASGFAAPPRPRKEERKERAVFAMNDNIDAAVRANEQLKTGVARMSLVKRQLTRFASRKASGDEDSCEPFDAARILDELASVVGLAKNAVGIVTASLELVKESVRPATKQDAVGANASVAETGISVPVGISKLIEQAIGFDEQLLKVAALIAGRVQDVAQALCVQRVDTGVADLQVKAGETSAMLEALDTKVDNLSARLDEAILLLLTPHGQRPGFPNN